jgi:hypothetical protein
MLTKQHLFFGAGDAATANVAEGTTTVATYSATDADGFSISYLFDTRLYC